MALSENIEELLSDLFDYGAQTVYAVTCRAEGFAHRWGWFDTWEEAKTEADALQARHGVDFRPVSMVLTPRVSYRKL